MFSAVKHLAAVSLAVVAMSVQADDVAALLGRARALELESAAVLLDHYRFEDDLISSPSDRLVVFLGMPHGTPVILQEVVLYLDGKPVAAHPYSVDDLMVLRGHGAQLFYTTRIPPGIHTIKAGARVLQGRVKVMQQPYKFSKGRKAKFIRVQFAGLLVREFEFAEW